MADKKTTNKLLTDKCKRLEDMLGKAKKRISAFEHKDSDQ